MTKIGFVAMTLLLSVLAVFSFWLGSQMYVETDIWQWVIAVMSIVGCIMMILGIAIQEGETQL